MKRLFILSFLLCFLVVPQANATVYTFDTAYANSLVENPLSSFSDEGLTFTKSNSNDYLYLWGGSSPNSNGTNNLIFNSISAGDYVGITLTGGGTFNIISLDMSVSFYGYSNSDIRINGDWYTLTQGIQTYNLNLFGITELQITGFGGGNTYWLLDNVTYNTEDNDVPGVPEPTTMLLLGLGLIGLAGVRRKIKK